jgi:hypothetical protein
MSILRVLMASALGLVFLAPPGLARDVRHPASGEPALSASLPDDWTATTVDDGSTISVMNPDHKIAFALTVATRADSLDDVARSMLEALNGTLDGKRKASLSGYAGETYTWSYINDGGGKIDVTTTLVKVGDKLTACSKMEVDGNPTAHRALAETVMQSIKIIPSGPGK